MRALLARNARGALTTLVITLVDTPSCVCPGPTLATTPTVAAGPLTTLRSARLIDPVAASAKFRSGTPAGSRIATLPSGSRARAVGAAASESTRVVDANVKVFSA